MPKKGNQNRKKQREKYKANNRLAINKELKKAREQKRQDRIQARKDRIKVSGKDKLADIMLNGTESKWAYLWDFERNDWKHFGKEGLAFDKSIEQKMINEKTKLANEMKNKNKPTKKPKEN